MNQKKHSKFLILIFVSMLLSFPFYSINAQSLGQKPSLTPARTAPPSNPGIPGPQGPQGPQGPKGEQGVQGPQGPQGPKGSAADFAVPYTGTPTLGPECTNGSVTGSDMAGRVQFNLDQSKMYCTLNFSKAFQHPPICVASMVSLFGNEPYVVRVAGTHTSVAFALSPVEKSSGEQNSTIQINYICMEVPTASKPIEIEKSTAVPTLFESIFRKPNP